MLKVLRVLLVKVGLIASPSVESSVGLTTRVLDTLCNQDTAGLRGLLPWPLKLFLSDKQGDRLWSQLRALLGAPKSFTKPRLHEDGFLRTMKSLVTFERCRLGVTVRLLGNSVIGANVHAPISIGLTPEWKAPIYVEEANLSDHDVTLPGALGLKIGGTLTLPKFKGRKPAVLMLPGSGPGDRDLSIGANKPFKDLAYGLASSGIVILRMDKSMKLIMLKTFVTKSITLYDEYIPGGVAALKYLSSHPEVDSSQIFVMGLSLGGGVAPRLCAASPHPIAGMISLAGNAIPLIDGILSQTEYLQQHLPKPQADYEKERQTAEEVKQLLQSGKATSRGENPAAQLPVPVPMSYFIDDFQNDPVEIARTLSMPMLFVQGEDDWQVTMHSFEKWRNGLKDSPAGRNATFRTYEGVSHLLIKFKNREKGMLQFDEPGHVEEDIVRDVVQWIQQVVQN